MVFDEIMGVPAHPLLIHAAVVFVPLLIAAAVAYALVPKFRGKVGWVAALLAVGAPFAAWFATISGNRLRTKLVSQGFPAEILDQVAAHKSYGDKTLWATIVLAILTAALIAVTSGHPRVPTVPRWTAPVLSALIVASSIVAAYYVFKTGDTGAKAVWVGF